MISCMPLHTAERHQLDVLSKVLVVGYHQVASETVTVCHHEALPTVSSPLLLADSHRWDIGDVSST